MIDFFMDPSLFLKEVLDIVKSKKCTHMEAVLEVCEKQGIEPESSGAIIKEIEPLKQAIKADAVDLHFFKSSSNSLPIFE